MDGAAGPVACPLRPLRISVPVRSPAVRPPPSTRLSPPHTPGPIRSHPLLSSPLSAPPIASHPTPTQPPPNRRPSPTIRLTTPITHIRARQLHSLSTPEPPLILIPITITRHTLLCFCASVLLCRLALQNALRYVPAEHHAVLGPEFAAELQEYGHIFMFRFRPTHFEMKAHHIGMYPAKCQQAAAIMMMIMNNLDPAVAQVREEDDDKDEEEGEGRREEREGRRRRRRRN